MPIPTRSASLRDPRKQTSTIGRTATSKTASTSTTSTDNAAMVPAKEPNTLRKTLSAPRNTPLQDETQSVARKPESRLSQRGTTQQVPGATRRQSLIRPSPLKSTSTASPTTKPSTVSPALTSPRKPQTPKEFPQKRTEMLPLSRPGRSVSVKQSGSTTSTPSTPARGHTRHRSQIVTPVTTNETSKKTGTPFSPSFQRQKTQPSTYQQHITPRKPVKPGGSTATCVGADPPTLISSSWPEIAALQTELLQLNLLHSSAVQRSVEWQTESEALLQKKYDSVAATYKSILEDEREKQRRLNAQALGIWFKNSRERRDRQGFSEQIQLFSQVAQEISALSGPDGRYTLVIQEFEDWFQAVDEIRESRSRPSSGSMMGNMSFIDPLCPEWKNELNELLMKLELCAKQLQSLDILGYGELEQLEDSALLRIANGLRDMTDTMISEIKTIRAIEADILRLERLWVGQYADRLIETRPAKEDGERVGAWRKGKT